MSNQVMATPVYGGTNPDGTAPQMNQDMGAAMQQPQMDPNMAQPQMQQPQMDPNAQMAQPQMQDPNAQMAQPQMQDPNVAVQQAPMQDPNAPVPGIETPMQAEQPAMDPNAQVQQPVQQNLQVDPNVGVQQVQPAVQQPMQDPNAMNQAAPTINNQPGIVADSGAQTMEVAEIPATQNVVTENVQPMQDPNAMAQPNMQQPQMDPTAMAQPNMQDPNAMNPAMNPQMQQPMMQDPNAMAQPQMNPQMQQMNPQMQQPQMNPQMQQPQMQQPMMNQQMPGQQIPGVQQGNMASNPNYQQVGAHLIPPDGNAVDVDFDGQAVITHLVLIDNKKGKRMARGLCVPIINGQRHKDSFSFICFSETSAFQCDIMGDQRYAGHTQLTEGKGQTITFNGKWNVNDYNNEQKLQIMMNSFTFDADPNLANLAATYQKPMPINPMQQMMGGQGGELPPPNMMGNPAMGAPGMNPAMNPQMQPGMDPNAMNPAMNPQMNPAMNPQMNPAMQQPVQQNYGAPQMDPNQAMAQAQNPSGAGAAPQMPNMQPMQQ